MTDSPEALAFLRDLRLTIRAAERAGETIGRTPREWGARATALVAMLVSDKPTTAERNAALSACTALYLATLVAPKAAS